MLLQRVVNDEGLPCGLRTLPELKKEVARDLRRTGATIALNRSMDGRLLRQTPGRAPSQMGTVDDATGVVPPVVAAASSQEQGLREERRNSVRRTSVVGERRSSFVQRNILFHEEDFGLEDAFNAHRACFDMDGDGKLTLEEVIIVFDRCNLFNEHVGKEKVRDYFRTWGDGCNHHMGLTEPLNDEGISFKEFRHVLRWMADMNRIEFESCVAKVISLSKRLCDKSASVQRKLEVIFDSFGKTCPDRMNAFEFGDLCHKVGLQLSVGDVFLYFSRFPGGVQGEGVDFRGFVQLIGQIGERMQLGEEVYEVFAKALDLLDNGEEIIRRVGMRMRQAAAVVSGAKWRAFFQECGVDSSQGMDWDDFKDLCRDRLHMPDKDTHLRLVFEVIDKDGSDELSLQELVDFLAQDG